MSFNENVNSKPVWKLFLWLSLPMLVIAIVNTAYNVIDRILIGRNINEFAVAAINISSPIRSFISIAGMVIGMSIATLLALNLGKRDESTAKYSMHQGILSGLLFCIIVSIIINLRYNDICIGLLGSPGESTLSAYLKEYLKIGVYGQLFMVINSCLIFTLIAQGHPYAAMVSVLVSFLFKLVFSWILILPLQISGASWSTIISQIFQIMFLLVFINKKAILKFNILWFKPNKMFLYMLIYIIAYSMVHFIRPALFLANYANSTDLVSITSISIVQTYVSIAFLFITCIKQSFQIIIGYNYGSQSFNRVMIAFKTAVLISTIFTFFIFLLLQFFPKRLISFLYTTNGLQSVSIDEVIKNIRIAVILLPLSGFLIISGNLFIMTGQILKAILISLLHDFIIIGAIVLIWISKKISLIQSIPIYDFISILIIGIFIIFELRKIIYKQKNIMATQG
jgi:Na+-driven multidrug efflux pump